MTNSTDNSLSSDLNLQVEANEIDLVSLAKAFWRGKLWILLFAAIFVALGGYYVYKVATPLYTSTISLVVTSNQNSVIDFDSVVSGVGQDQSSINTELEVVKSRDLVGKLVDELDLLDDPEFNGFLRNPPVFSIANLLATINPKPKTLPSDFVQREAAINSVLSKISARAEAKSLVFKISATTHSAEKSALILNKLADLYIKEQILVKFEGTENATQWLSERVSELKFDLENSEKLIKGFSSSNELVSPETLASANRQINDLRERSSGLSNKLDELKIIVAAKNSAWEKRNIEQIRLLSNDSILNQILDTSSLDDPKVNERFQFLIEKDKEEIEKISAQSFSINEALVVLQKQTDSHSEKLVELEQLQRETEANRLIYEYFLGRLKEASVQKGIQQADTRVLSKAVPKYAPSSPKKPIILAFCFILGSLVGAGLILFREQQDNKIRTSVDLEKLTNIPVIGQIPVVPAKKRSSVIEYLVNKPNSAAAEAIRNLRTSVLLSNIDSPPRVIMSTSSLPGEGKTTQSLALAQNFSGLGQKVLLIEGDIRRRVFSQYFDIKDKKGLLAVLSGKEKLSDAVEYVETLGADVLIGTKSNSNAADVFSSKAFKTLLDTARKEYDIVIIDTPPVLIVPDARVIGQSVDAIIYTVKWNMTTKTQVREGIKMFAQVKLKVSGLVLGQIDVKGMKKYGYGGEYGAYGSYGEKYYHN